MRARLRLGTRGSALARWQAGYVGAQLAAHDCPCEIVVITTSGDRNTSAPLASMGGKGLFTKEIEEALGDRRIDFAVHSLKDVPSELAGGFALAAVMEREDARDALVGAPGVSLANLPAGARLGTSSLRRQAQALALRPDVRVLPLRGNVDTRLRQWQAGEFDAILLAAAGLKRLGLEGAIAEWLDPATFCPAGGQGALGLECREDDQATRAILARLHHHATGEAVGAERALLRRLDCGCQAPVGAHARLRANGQLGISAMVATPDGRRSARVDALAAGHTAGELGRDAAEILLQRGAAAILAGLPRAE